MGSDEQAIQREALAESLEQPLRAELIENGYSPRNAAIAASSMLDMYAQCLASTHNANMDSEPEVTNVWLGGLAVTVYRSDCLTEFLDNVADLP